MVDHRRKMDSAISEIDEYWDGYDRRNGGSDRRYHQLPPPPSFYNYPPNYSPPQQNSQTADSKNVAQTTLTLQQIGSMMLVVGSILIGGFSAWSNLNKELDLQKNNFDQFKTQIGHDMNEVQMNIRELRKINEDIRSQNQKTAEALERRIQDLDASLTQIYQKISAK